MTKPILKEQAIAAYGTGVKLADALGITPSAVYQWDDGEPIPNEHTLRLRYELKPEIFGDAANDPAAGFEGEAA
jgi:hypothetical protein